VFEAPPGVKMNLQRTYSSWSSDFLAGHASTTAAAAGNSSVQQQQLAVPADLVPLRAQLLFLLAWFNAVVQERRSYVPYVSVLVSSVHSCYACCLVHLVMCSCCGQHSQLH
jgi:hypothetical protein